MNVVAVPSKEFRAKIYSKTRLDPGTVILYGYKVILGEGFCRRNILVRYLMNRKYFLNIILERERKSGFD